MFWKRLLLKKLIKSIKSRWSTLAVCELNRTKTAVNVSGGNKQGKEITIEDISGAVSSYILDETICSCQLWRVCLQAQREITCCIKVIKDSFTVSHDVPANENFPAWLCCDNTLQNDINALLFIKVFKVLLQNLSDTTRWGRGPDWRTRWW